MRRSAVGVVVLLSIVGGCATDDGEVPPTMEAPSASAKLESVAPLGAGRCRVTISLSDLSATYSGTVTISDESFKVIGQNHKIEIDTGSLNYGMSYPVSVEITHFTSKPQPIRLKTSMMTPPLPFTGPNPAQGGDASRISFVGSRYQEGTSIHFGVRRSPSDAEQFISGSAGMTTSDGMSFAAPVLLATDPADPPTFAGAIPPVRIYLAETLRDGSVFRSYLGDFQYRYRMSQPQVASGRSGGEISLVLWYPLRSPGADITLSAKLGTAPLTFVGASALGDLTESGWIFVQRVRYQVPAIPAGTYRISISDAFGEEFISSRPVMFEVLP